jgi:CBS domain containing-hemolysin-like protein
MNLPLFIIMILGALLFAFLFGIVDSLTKEELQLLAEINPKKTLKLKQTHNNFNKNYSGFELIELILLFISIISLSNYLISYQINFIISIVAIVIIGFSYYMFRALVISFGERNSNRFALKFSLILYIVHLLTNPLVELIEKMTRQIKGKTETEESINEIHELFETAREEGSLDADEYRLLKNIMNFSEVLVMDVMTPRTVIFSFNANKEVSEVVNNPELQTFSRFPIWDGVSLDDKIVGYVLSKDIFGAALNNELNKPLKNFARDVYIIPETADLSVALEKFLKRRQHLFLVVDEYGNVSGLITMEDVLETILGVEILDEADKVTDLRKLAVEKRNNRIKSITTGSTIK